jgi:RNase P/RNase MRP subunit POP5
VYLRRQKKPEMLEVDHYINIIKTLEVQLTRIELNNIQAKSLYNFLLFYDQLKGDEIKQKVRTVIKEYFSEIQANNYQISVIQSRELYSKYIIKIGRFYNYQLGFKARMSLDAAAFLGIIVDLLLLLLGILKLAYYIPIASISFIGYNRILFYSLAKKNKLYGPRY